MKLEIIDMPEKDWDKEIEKFDTKSIFHQSAWLKFIEETQNARVIRMKIIENSNIIGYFPFFIEKKGIFKILSSSRPGCNTPHMGPVINKDFNQNEFLRALEEYCKEKKISQVEIASPFLKPEIMLKNGFQSHNGTSFIFMINDEDAMWKALGNKSRNVIRKAIKNDLIVEDTENPDIVKDYYEQLKQVFTRQKLVPTYSLERVASLFNNLKKQGLLFSLKVTYKNKVIATGLFVHNNKEVYFFGGASLQEYNYLKPNNLLHWELMKMASKKNIRKYDLGGGGEFKRNLGAREIVTYRYSKSYHPLAKIARKVYQLRFKAMQRLKGMLK